MDLTEVVARNIRRLRQERKMSQEELAERVGISSRYVGSLERAVHSPTVAVLERIAAALEVEPGLLLKR